ncbi:MAG: hypothetical protein RBU24_00030 [Kiritimatiellia bacterium]|jgi:hypothetical protein|nr:hypothetical protein [Kiritimatiellia bacterium]
MSVNNNPREAFLVRLERCRSVWRRSLSYTLFLRLAGWVVLALTAYFLSDYFLALDERVRVVLNVVLPFGLLVAASPEAIRIARLGLGDAAVRADRCGKHRRNEVQTAWELLEADRPAREDEQAGELSAFLVRRALAEADKRLVALGPRTLRPKALTAARARLLGLQTAAALGVVLLYGMEAFQTVAPRLLWPKRDIPPFSRYRFEVSPDAPAIIYGGAAEVSVTVSGDPVSEQVWLMTRRGRQRSQRVACFQDGGGKYAQRLENVTVPVEFCFGVGRARSRWHRVDLHLQPQIVIARVRLAPPSYTRQPAREFAVGQENVEGVRGSRVTLMLTSNRPIKEGVVTLKRRHVSSSGEQVVRGRLVSERTAAFDWVLEEDADAEAVLRDVQGTPTAEPLALQQKRLPDEAPKVLVSEPPEFSLATPSAVIKVSGHAEDDFGLDRLDWIRGVVGFNDRAMSLKRGDAGTLAEFDMEIRLGALGVREGQVLEFYAEALDNNPYLSGIGASGIARVKVISEDEYAELLRNRETLDQFSARYEAASGAIRKTIGGLEALKEFLAKNPNTETRTAELKKLVTAHIAAETLFQHLARDFAVYDSERALGQASSSVLGKLGENRLDLENLMRTPPDAHGSAQVAAMIARLKDDAAAIEKQEADAELIAKIAKVMDGAARFRALLQMQEELVRHLKQRFGGNNTSAEMPFLPGYGEEQAVIAKELRGFLSDVKGDAEALPESMAKLKRDTLAFLQAIAQTGAAEHMDKAAGASGNSDATGTSHEAQRALEKLKGTLGPESAVCENDFQGMCKGQTPGSGPENLRKTLQQMFRALCRKRGVGQGEGMGAGQGFPSGLGTGSRGDGYSEVATPVYGPGRSPVSMKAERRGIGGPGRGPGKGEPGRQPDVVERVKGADALAPSGEAVPFEQLPAKYRDAVKRYFSTGAEGGVK